MKGNGAKRGKKKKKTVAPPTNGIDLPEKKVVN